MHSKTLMGALGVALVAAVIGWFIGDSGALLGAPAGSQLATGLMAGVLLGFAAAAKIQAGDDAGEASGRKTLYVGNMPFSATETEIRAAFSTHGAVHSVKLLTDRHTGRPRGVSFVEMDNEAADKAMAALNGSDFGGRNIKVNEAGPNKGRRRPHPSRRHPRH